MATPYSLKTVLVEPALNVYDSTEARNWETRKRVNITRDAGNIHLTATAAWEAYGRIASQRAAWWEEEESKRRKFKINQLNAARHAFEQVRSLAVASGI